jgi:hypothetical protein
MQRVSSVVFVCMAVCATGAVVASSASAASALPLFSTATAGTATSGEVTLSFESTKTNCKKSNDTFGAGQQLGTFRFHFEECRSLAEPCLGLAQALGSIEYTGEWHLVSLKAERTHYEIWLLIPLVHIECVLPTSTLLLVSGNILGLIKAQGTSERTFEIAIKTEGSGSTLKQALTEFGNDSGTAVAASLKGSIDGGTEKAWFENWESLLLFTEKSTKLLET